MSRGSLDQAKQRKCMTFWLSCGTKMRRTSDATLLDAPMPSCCGALKGAEHGYPVPPLTKPKVAKAVVQVCFAGVRMGPPG